MERKVYVRHSSKTKYLAHVNSLLTDVQKTCIQTTPFAWLLSIDLDIKMSRNLLLQLCSTWLERRGGFQVRSVFIPFTKLDVCLGLGVRVNGQMFKLIKDEVHCHSRTLVDTSDVTVFNVYEELKNRIKGDEVEDVCRLYILLGLSEFFFPNRGGKVHLGLFELVDDLSCLGKYNWGGAIYEYLVASLCDAALCVQKRQKRSHCHVVGCVFALQIWAMEHVLFAQNKLAKSKSCVPRILHWMQVKVGEAEVEKAFSSNQVITEVYVTKEEMAVEIVKEALDCHHNAGVKDNFSRPSYCHIVGENEALRSIIVQQEVSIALLEEVVHKLQSCHSKNMQRKGCHGRTPCPFKNSKPQRADDSSGGQGGKSNSKEDDMVVDDIGSRSLQKCNEIVVYGVGKSNSENGVVLEKGTDIFSDVGKAELEKSDMYTRLKGEPRKRVKSVSLKTPWTKLDRKTRRR